MQGAMQCNHRMHVTRDIQVNIADLNIKGYLSVIVHMGAEYGDGGHVDGEVIGLYIPQKHYIV